MGAQLRGEIEEAEAALEAAKSNDLPLSLKSCQLDASDSEQWDVLLTDPMFHGASCHSLQLARLKAPPQISEP